MNVSTNYSSGQEGKIDFIKWNPRYEIGIPLVDEQHKHLVELCARLHESVLNTDRNGQRESLIIALKECVEYVNTHFSTEERLMKNAGYKGFAAHKARHEEFTKKILSTARELESKSFMGARKFVMFLRDWILSHISYEDKLFGPCVLEWMHQGGNILSS